MADTQSLTNTIKYFFSILDEDHLFLEILEATKFAKGQKFKDAVNSLLDQNWMKYDENILIRYKPEYGTER